MIKALWFLLKIAALIALVIWIAERPGSVRLEWLDYVFTIHVGLFLLIGLATIILAIFIYQAIKGFIDFPKSYRRYAEIRAREKGYKALTLGLTAVAAGDTNAALHQAGLATKFLPGDTGLPLLLQAQSARLDGREDDATTHFLALLEDKDASFLGLRGLLQKSLDMKDYSAAKSLADKALMLHPKQPWLLKITYDLHIRAREWDKSRKILYRAEKAKAITPAKAQSDRVAILLAEAREDIKNDQPAAALKKLKKAENFDKKAPPATLMLARFYQKNGENRKARSLLEKAWKIAPHESYIPVWAELLPIDADPLAKLQHFEKLLALGNELALGFRYAGEAALGAGLWGEAREHFTRAESIQPSAKLYRLWAKLEEKSTHDEAAIKDWLKKALSAEADKTWVCRETGQTYEEWTPRALPHGAFNTIEWLSPSDMGQSRYVVLLDEQTEMAETLIEAPAA